MNSQDNPELFFARQVINNACGTQALLSVLLNITDERVKLGETLQNFTEFTQCLDAEMTGTLMKLRYSVALCTVTNVKT